MTVVRLSGHGKGFTRQVSALFPRRRQTPLNLSEHFCFECTSPEKTAASSLPLCSLTYLAAF